MKALKHTLNVPFIEVGADLNGSIASITTPMLWFVPQEVPEF
jgi:hypothetical protein